MPPCQLRLPVGLPPSALPVGAPVSTAARKTSSTTSWLASTSAGQDSPGDGTVGGHGQGAPARDAADAAGALQQAELLIIGALVYLPLEPAAGHLHVQLLPPA